MPVRIRKITAESEPLNGHQVGYISFSLKVDFHNNRPPLFSRSTIAANDFQSNMKIFLDIMVREIEAKLSRQFTIERNE